MIFLLQCIILNPLIKFIYKEKENGVDGGKDNEGDGWCLEILGSKKEKREKRIRKKKEKKEKENLKMKNKLLRIYN